MCGTGWGWTKKEADDCQALGRLGSLLSHILAQNPRILKPGLLGDRKLAFQAGKQGMFCLDFLV
jgi:hypothetical protein